LYVLRIVLLYSGEEDPAALEEAEKLRSGDGLLRGVASLTF
jgi:hypothetical protein